MTYLEAKKKLEEAGQQHVLAFWPTLSRRAREALLAQIATIDFVEFARCRATLPAFAPAVAQATSVAPRAPKVAELTARQRLAAAAVGQKELAAGRVAALLVAGGQGSRLGFDGPKGCYPIGPVTEAPLFRFHARKILAKTLQYGKRVPFYIMTSEANRAATEACFVQHDHFGLNPKDVIFFTQGMWPGMTADGKIIMERRDKIFMSPDGHGGLLAALKRSGALSDMKRRGIRDVFYFQVDNPLVDIADEAFLGYHVQRKSDFTLKLCAKRDPYEKVGMPMLFGKTAKMVEYTEMTDEQCNRRDADGKLYFRFGSPAIHVFDRAFLEREADKPMPLHLAHKKIACVDARGADIKPREPNGYKFEKFIFDVLPDARPAAFLAFEAEDEFSPVKNAEGADSPATCRRDLSSKGRKILEAHGIFVSKEAAVEVDPCAFVTPKRER